jgi:hypothetical protein
MQILLLNALGLYSGFCASYSLDSAEVKCWGIYGRSSSSRNCCSQPNVRFLDLLVVVLRIRCWYHRIEAFVPLVSTPPLFFRCFSDDSSKTLVLWAFFRSSLD